VSKVSPLYPTKRTSMKGVVTSLMGQKATLAPAGRALDARRRAARESRPAVCRL